MQKYQYFGELRSLGNESRRVEGRALSFNKESLIICEQGRYFTETLAPGCITDEVLNRSNIVLNYNHGRGQILARWNKGVGSLSLELREDGLYFSTDLPNTRHADEVLEQVRRGDLQECSFAFYVDEDSLIWERNSETGLMHRTVTSILELRDVSIVVDPAYSDDATYVSARSAELEAAERAMEDKEKEEKEETETPDESKEEEVRESKPDEKEDDTEPENADSGEDTPETTSKSEETEEKEDEKEEKRNTKINSNNHNIMKKNITFAEQLRSALNGGEKRFTVNFDTPSERTMTVNGVEGQMTGDPAADPYAIKDTAIVEHFESLVEPLYENQVIKNLGIKVYSGLKGNVNVPVIGKGTCGWASEIATAVASGNTTTNVYMAPKRIAAYVDISKLTLLQDELGIFEAIKRDLYNAVADKIQASMLDTEAKSDIRPAGLLNGLEAGTVANFKDLCLMEADLQDVHFDNVQYLVGNRAYASLRNLPKSAKTTELVLEHGSIDGVNVTRTGVLANKVVLGDFSNVILGVWANAEIVVDDLSKAAEGLVRVVINAYVDWTPVRPGAIKVATIA